jgi:tetratricopeptide (TPR) repeat protein
MAHLLAGIFVQGCFEAAIQDYTHAIGLNPGHCRACYNRAFSHDRLGQYEEAVADYTRALQIEPANATALHNRGSLFERLGRCVQRLGL